MGGAEWTRATAFAVWPRTGGRAVRSCWLRWKHVLGHIRAEAQVHQNEAPDSKGDKGAQAWCGGFLGDREKGRKLRRGQVSRWRGDLPSMEPPG